jgi:hypothetical protein
MENLNELYNDICERARANGTVTQEAWDDLVREVVEEYRTNGLVDDDDPTEGMEDALNARFTEFHDKIMDEGVL